MIQKLNVINEIKRPDFDQEVLKPLREEQARQQAEAERKAREAREAELASTAGKLMPYGTYGNSYSGGNCTYYVASRVAVPSYLGNAGAWDTGLASAGWRSGGPRRGAVAVTNVGWAGHVAIVEEVLPDGSVHISEMNYAGLGVISHRYVSPSEFTYWYL